MNRRTFIQWCDYTYNPWIGCTKVSPGCAHCYAAERDKRHMQDNVEHWGKGAPRYRTSESTRNSPYKWNKRPWICDGCGKAVADADKITHLVDPRTVPCQQIMKPDGKGGLLFPFHRARVFLGSLMDIFDDEVDPGWLGSALWTVKDCKDIDFLLVTKRPENFFDRVYKARNEVWKVADYGPGFADWLDQWLHGNAPPNVWMITSTENQDMADKRIPELLKIPAVVHGLSCEPLLGPIDLLPMENLEWVIAGGESGPNARPMDVQWMHDIQKQCEDAGVAYFAKQLGAMVTTENANLHDWPDETVMTVCYGYPQAAGGRALLKDKKGGKMEEWPPELCVRQWPTVNR